MLKPNLYNYSDVYILVKRITAVADTLATVAAVNNAKRKETFRI